MTKLAFKCTERYMREKAILNGYFIETKQIVKVKILSLGKSSEITPTFFGEGDEVVISHKTAFSHLSN